jgi:hypothetical protein
LPPSPDLLALRQEPLPQAAEIGLEALELAAGEARRGGDARGDAGRFLPELPLMLKTASNPEGTPLEAFDGIRKGTALNRSQFFKDLTMPVYGCKVEPARFNADVLAFIQS